MEATLKDVQDHFSAGRFDEAIECLARTPMFKGNPPDQVRQLVEVKTAESFIEWGRTKAESTVLFDSHRRAPGRSTDVYYVENGSVVARPLEFIDEDPAVFLVPNATIAAGLGTISTEDGTVLPVVSGWGQQTKKGDVAKRSYGVLATRDEANQYLGKRFSATRTIPEALYLWAGCKHFSINLVNLMHVALLTKVARDRRIPLVAQRKGLFRRQVESDALRKMGFDEREIIFVDDLPTTRVEKLWVPYCPITLFPARIINSSAAINNFRKTLGVVPRDRSTQGEKIYISRRDAKWRRTENEDELLELVKSYGFRILEFSQLNLDQKMKELSNAQVVLGSLGSNMANATFAPTGCWVVEIVAEWYPDPAVRDCIANWTLSMDLEYLRIPCDVRPTEDSWSRWDINVRIDELRVGLDFLMDQLASEERLVSAA